MMGLVVLAAVLILVTLVGAEQCPLEDLRNFEYDSHCYVDTAKNATQFGKEVSICCFYTLRRLSIGLAVHANQSSGQLFLPSAQQNACIDDLNKRAGASNLQNFNMSVCDAKAFIAGSSPCAFANVSEVRDTLDASLHSNATFTHLLNECNSGNCSRCRTSFDTAVRSLADTAKDTQYVCAAALLVTLGSVKATDYAWLNGVYSCLDISDAGNIIRPTSNPLNITAILGGLLLGFAVLSLVFICIFRKRGCIPFNCSRDEKDDHYGYGSDGLGELQSRSNQPKQVEKRHSEGLYTFSAKEIHKATNNFSEDNFIGEGSAGKVFKGILPSGQFVAVKRIDKERKLDTFIREVENLSKVRHPHLVSLLGYCESGHEYDLVYEYCSKGNLSQWLFRDGASLTWEQRLKIAVNSARGLWHLHNYQGGSIIHRDIKPTNILLNEHLEAKLSDFGLSRFIAIEESRVFTEVKGTAGYLDPEYITFGQLTLASDVYSFGIVLLQLLSGRRVIDLDPTHRLSLVKTAKLIASEGDDISKFADPRLNGAYSVLAFEKILHVAVDCTAYDHADRLSMSEVLADLEEAWQISNYSITAALPHSSRDNNNKDTEDELDYAASPSYSIRSRETYSTTSYNYSGLLRSPSAF